MQRVINDNIDFCWTAICMLDPEYRQYCENSYIRRVELEDAYGMQKVAQAVEPVEEAAVGIFERVRRFTNILGNRQINPAVAAHQVVVPEVQQQEDTLEDDIPFVQTIDPVQPAQPAHIFRSGHRDYTEEELSVLNEVACAAEKKEEPSDFAAAADSPAKMQTIPNRIKPKKRKELTLEELAAREKKHQSHSALQLAWSQDFQLKKEIKEANEFAGNPNPGVLLLTCPKTLLAGGSVVWQTEHSVYELHDTSSECRLGVEFFRYSVKVGRKDSNIRLCRDTFYGDRQKGFIRQKRHQSERLVYNVTTGNLYDFAVTKEKKKKPIKRLLSANYLSKTSVSGTFNYPILFTTFHNLVLESVRKTIQDVKDLGPEHTAFIAFQHRYKKSIPWMTEDLWRKLCASVHIGRTGTEDNYGMPDKKDIKKVLAKFHRIFKKHTNYSGLVQAVFQDRHRNLFRELFSKHATVSLIQMSEALSKHDCPPELYHFMVNIFRNYESVTFSRGGTWEDKPTDAACHFANVLGDLGDYSDVAHMWVKLCRRFVEEYNGVLMDWITFRDMARMADRYHVRIRINKLKDPQDVKMLHDKLVEIQNRDDRAWREFKGKTIPFISHPTDEYDGFTFVFLDTAEKLVEEGKNMHHCVGGYTYQCMKGDSIIFSMRKGDRGYVTIELSGENLSIKQKYTIGDNTIENETFNGIINRWHTDMVKLHANDTNSYKRSCEIASKNEIRKLISERVIDLGDVVEVTAYA